MSVFPGNILIIDDQFDIVYKDEPQEVEKKIQYKSFKDIKRVSEENCIPLISISDLSDISNVLEKISKYRNVRLLILDLDLNESGDIEEDDEIFIKAIILKAISSFGYFFLLINSSYAERWDEIKKTFPEDFNCQKLIENLCDSYNKNDKHLEERILDLLTNKYSVEVISQFEVGLNNAKDKVLGNFLDFSKATWESVMKNLRKDFDSREHVNYTITQFLIGLIKQFLINVSYSETQGQPEHDEDLLKDITIGLNYILNNDHKLKDHPIWTGNLYKNNYNDLDKKYLLVITPECDIAQSKAGNLKVLYGFEVNEVTFPKEYKSESYKGNDNPPLLVKKLGKVKNGDWKKRDDIDKKNGFPQSLYFLPYASENGKHIYLDFHNSSSLDDLQKPKHELIARINEPIITDIIDRYANSFNRKGLPSFLPKDFKLDTITVK